MSLLLAGLAALLPLPARAQAAPPADPAIAAMMAEVETDTLLDLVNQLTGETPVTVDGEASLIESRAYDAGDGLEMATQFAYAFLEEQGLDVRFQEWEECDIEGRNVIGELAGDEVADELVLVTAHLDSTSDDDTAPGADDNASGSAAVMAMAEILAPHTFPRTLRFVLFTGEEEGLCGSIAYVDEALEEDEAIVAVYNMDMIAWNSDKAPIMRLHTRTEDDPGYAADLAIAQTLIEVVDAYGLGRQLLPVITPDGLDESDTFSFWEAGYPGVLAIEDDGADVDDFNPNYHSADDTVDAFNLAYYTSFVKASVGAVATLAAADLDATSRRALAGEDEAKAEAEDDASEEEGDDARAEVDAEVTGATPGDIYVSGALELADGRLAMALLRLGRAGDAHLVVATFDDDTPSATAAGTWRDEEDAVTVSLDAELCGLLDVPATAAASGTASVTFNVDASGRLANPLLTVHPLDRLLEDAEE